MRKTAFSYCFHFSELYILPLPRNPTVICVIDRLLRYTMPATIVLINQIIPRQSLNTGTDKNIGGSVWTEHPFRFPNKATIGKEARPSQHCVSCAVPWDIATLICTRRMWMSDREVGRRDQVRWFRSIYTVCKSTALQTREQYSRENGIKYITSWKCFCKIDPNAAHENWLETLRENPIRDRCTFDMKNVQYILFHMNTHLTLCTLTAPSDTYYKHKPVLL